MLACGSFSEASSDEEPAGSGCSEEALRRPQASSRSGPTWPSCDWRSGSCGRALADRQFGARSLQESKKPGQEAAVSCSPTGRSCSPGPGPRRLRFGKAENFCLGPFGRCARSGPWNEVCSWVMGRGEVPRQANLRPTGSSKLLQGEHSEISASRARAAGIHDCTHFGTEVDTIAPARRPVQR